MGMIVILLTLIVLILLFGAAAVRGWLSKLAAIVIGAILFVAFALLITSWIGETGFWIVSYGVGALLLVGSIAVRLPGAFKPSADERRRRAQEAWNKWEAEIKFVEGTLTKAEKRRIKRQALGRRPD